MPSFPMSTFSSTVLHALALRNMKPRSIRCMKFFLTLCNIICILLGLTLMGLSVMSMREKKTKPDDQETPSKGMLAFFLTLGLCLVITTVLGCVGALRENVKILYVHACFFTFLLSVEVVVGVGSAVLRNWKGGHSDLRILFYKNVTTEDGPDSGLYWNDLQFENQCCGIDGPEDYAVMQVDIPAACCPRAHPLREGGAKRHLYATCLAEKSYYARGCEEVIRRKMTFQKNMYRTGGVIFALVQMACVALAVWMARTIRTERRKLQQNLQAHFET